MSNCSYYIKREHLLTFDDRRVARLAQRPVGVSTNGRRVMRRHHPRQFIQSSQSSSWYGLDDCHSYTMNATLPAASKPIPIQKGRPLTGNLREFQRDTVGAIERAWREYGDIVRMKMGPRTLLLVSHPELAQQVLIERQHEFQRPRTISGGTALAPLMGMSVLTTDGDSWLSKRRLMQPIFHRQRIERMGDQMTHAAGAMLERWSRSTSSTGRCLAPMSCMRPMCRWSDGLQFAVADAQCA